jgi:alanyl-tRNA synthetase
LKAVLGNHVKQAGSLVSPNRLRFDFSHFKPMSECEIRKVETIVNEQIMNALDVITDEMDLDEAKKSGVTALFDEKYSRKVRVVRMGDFSAELCGGTHIKNTGQIGPFRIKSESGISSGVRRIEGATGWNSFKMIEEQRDLLKEVSSTLNTEEHLLTETVGKLQIQLKETNKKINELEEKLSQQNLNRAQSEIQEVDGIKYLAIVQENINPQVMRSVADNAIEKVSGGLVCLFNKTDSNVSFIVKVSKEIAGKTVHAGKMAKALASILGGGGGGRPDFAQAGGKNTGKLDEAVEAIPEIIRNAK